jgi:hypothetical protein
MGPVGAHASLRALRQRGRLDRAYRRSCRHGHGPPHAPTRLVRRNATPGGKQANTCWGPGQHVLGWCIRAAPCARVGPLATPKHVEDFAPRGFARGAFDHDIQVRDTTFDAAYQVVE